MTSTFPNNSHLSCHYYNTIESFVTRVFILSIVILLFKHEIILKYLKSHYFMYEIILKSHKIGYITPFSTLIKERKGGNP